MRRFLMVVICLTGLAGQVRAQQSWPPQIEGERHVYKQVGETQLNLWVLRGGVANAPVIVFFFGVAGLRALRNSSSRRLVIWHLAV